MHQTFIQDFIAGWIAGISSIVVVYPVDTIKVRQQYYSTGLLETLIRTYRYEGVRGFYKGVIFPLMISGPSNAVFFGVYGNCLNTFKSNTDGKFSSEEKTVVSHVTVASVLAAFVHTIVICPVEVLKIALQASTENKVAGHWTLDPKAIHYKNSREAIRDLYSSYRILGFYRGLLPMMLRDVPSSPVYMIIYETVHGADIPIMNKLWQEIFAGGIAGLVVWMFIFPLDVVKTRMQADNPTDPMYKSMTDCIKKSYFGEGIRVFFNGFSAVCIRAFPANAILLYTYQHTLAWLQKEY